MGAIFLVSGIADIRKICRDVLPDIEKIQKLIYYFNRADFLKYSSATRAMVITINMADCLFHLHGANIEHHKPNLLYNSPYCSYPIPPLPSDEDRNRHSPPIIEDHHHHQNLPLYPLSRNSA